MYPFTLSVYPSMFRSFSISLSFNTYVTDSPYVPLFISPTYMLTLLQSSLLYQYTYCLYSCQILNLLRKMVDLQDSAIVICHSLVSLGMCLIQYLQYNTSFLITKSFIAKRLRAKNYFEFSHVFTQSAINSTCKNSLEVLQGYSK